MDYLATTIWDQTTAIWVQTAAILIMGGLNLKMKSKERKLREEIETIKKLRDTQVSQYEQDLAAANARLAAAKLQVQALQGSGKDSVGTNILSHRGTVGELLRSQEFLARIVTVIAATAILAGMLGALI